MASLLVGMQTAFAAVPGGGVPAGPIYLRLAAGLRDAIRNGHVSVGSSLPPERELATQLGLSRQTVRRAVEMLTDEGLLIVR